MEVNVINERSPGLNAFLFGFVTCVYSTHGDLA